LKDAIGSLDLSSMICKNGNQTNELITRLFLFKYYTYIARGIIEKHHSVVLQDKQMIFFHLFLKKGEKIGQVPIGTSGKLRPRLS